MSIVVPILTDHFLFFFCNALWCVGVGIYTKIFLVWSEPSEWIRYIAIYLPCRASAIFGMPIILRYIYKSVSPLLAGRICFANLAIKEKICEGSKILWLQHSVNLISDQKTHRERSVRDQREKACLEKIPEKMTRLVFVFVFSPLLISVTEGVNYFLILHFFAIIVISFKSNGYSIR